MRERIVSSYFEIAFAFPNAFAFVGLFVVVGAEIIRRVGQRMQAWRRAFSVGFDRGQSFFERSRT